MNLVQILAFVANLLAISVYELFALMALNAASRTGLLRFLTRFVGYPLQPV